MGRDVVIMHLGTIDELLADSVAVPRFRTTLLGTFAVAALVLAAVGVYGVVAYSVVQRTHEIGVRIALGGQQTDILRLILGQGLQLTIAGLLIGLGISISLTSVLRGLLFQVKPADPMTLVSVAGVLGITSVLACYLPARRAASFDPMFAVRHE
jgi:putative ABC transport system permease protein